MSFLSEKNKGFTFTELMVTITITTVILTVLLLNQSKYNDRLVLNNLAEDTSLRIAQAQAYGSGVREFSTGSGEFSASYGLTFSLINDDDDGSPTAYLYFADRNNNDFYNGDWTCVIGGANECLERINILRGVYIEAVCMIIAPATSECGPPNSPRRVDITFNRPNTEAQLIFFNSSGGQVTNPNMVGARIIFRSPNTTATSGVTVYTTGQISTK
ncbi:MAG: prepilin-type N-terminal cleavage/methylation domain-containing protein [Minisyncoccia bacterium]